MRLYTKKGDDGTTSLSGDIRVYKTDSRIEFFGAIDELNAFLGFMITDISEEHDRMVLEQIQRKLFSVCAIFLDASRVENAVSYTDVEFLEKEIDDISVLLPSISDFIIPGGCRLAAHCNICRAVCRRVERRMLSMSQEYNINVEIRSYINRLSDYLFILSRKLNFITQTKEKTLHISCE